MVLSPKLLSLDVGAPLHLYIKKILELYDVVPIQVSPKSYKLAWALYIMYHDLELGTPSMREFRFFFGIRKSNPGYYNLIANKQHNNNCFLKARSIMNGNVRSLSSTYMT